MNVWRQIDPNTGMFTGLMSYEQPVLDTGEPDPVYIGDPITSDLWWPRWDGTQWVEGRTPEEVAFLKAHAQPTTPTPTPVERIAALEAAMLELILGGGTVG